METEIIRVAPDGASLSGKFNKKLSKEALDIIRPEWEKTLAWIEEVEKNGF